MMETFNIFRRCNKYIDETMPWTLTKDEAQKDRLPVMFYNLIESITTGTSLLYSSMPKIPGKILAQLNTGKRELAQMDTFDLYPSGGRVMDKPEILFAHMDMREVMEKVEATHVTDQVAEGAHTKGADDRGDTWEPGDTKENVIDVEVKPETIYEDFAKSQFQVGEIIRCEAAPKSKKLFCSQVKIGSQTRQVISDIKARHSPEEMMGKKVMVVISLKSVKLASILSEGMLLCAADADGGPAPARLEEDTPAGVEIC